jgi:hypothetical protein
MHCILLVLQVKSAEKAAVNIQKRLTSHALPIRQYLVSCRAALPAAACNSSDQACTRCGSKLGRCCSLQEACRSRQGAAAQLCIKPVFATDTCSAAANSCSSFQAVSTGSCLALATACCVTAHPPSLHSSAHTCLQRLSLVCVSHFLTSPFRCHFAADAADACRNPLWFHC